MKKLTSAFVISLIFVLSIFTLTACSVHVGNEEGDVEEGLNVLSSVIEDYSNETKEAIADDDEDSAGREIELNVLQETGSGLLESLDELDAELDKNEDGLDQATITSSKERVAEMRNTLETTLADLAGALPTDSDSSSSTTDTSTDAAPATTTDTGTDTSTDAGSDATADANS